jgi:hypothetical protein
MNSKPSSSPLPEAFLPLDMIDLILEFSMVSPELKFTLLDICLSYYLEI